MDSASEVTHKPDVYLVGFYYGILLWIRIRLIKTPVYMWRGFVTKNPGTSETG